MFADEAAYYRDILQMDAALRRTYDDTLARLERCTSPGRLLDVGCGNGILLEVAVRRGWTAEGVELSSYAAGLARERTGLMVHEGTLDKLALEPLSYDAVTLTQVIEHLVDPLDLLRRAAALLRPGGLLLVATPNPECWLARAKGERFNYWLIPAHATLYAPRALRLVLARAGLPVRRMLTWSSHEPALDDRLEVLAALPLPRSLRRGRPAAVLAQPLGWVMDAAQRGTITEAIAARPIDG
jgi:2-polyprenyl-3-methyl-5-hydroxy-6-metoxy-1,4-benzoquinol methylase